MNPDWLVYESAAKTVVANLRDALGLSHVEGKQMLPGASGAMWEVDAKAWCAGSDRFLVVEARRHTSSGLKQEEVGGIAFRIQDVGAVGGIVASPLPLQEGAKLVAASANVKHVTLAADSTPEFYLAEYMGQSYRGIAFTDSISIGPAMLISGELRDA